MFLFSFLYDLLHLGLKKHARVHSWLYLLPSSMHCLANLPFTVCGNYERAFQRKGTFTHIEIIKLEHQ